MSIRYFRTLASVCLITLLTACGAAQDSSEGDDAQDVPTVDSTSLEPSSFGGRRHRNPPVSPSAPPPAPAPTAPPAAPAAPDFGGPLRGTNLLGMEGDYSFNEASGPVADSDYAVHSNQIVDYLASKHVNVIRFLCSWERMQSTLNGPVPAATSGNYKTYFDNYKRIVDYATGTKGMTVIVEPWQASRSGDTGGPSWRGNVVGGGVVTSAHFANFWSKMATIFASNPRVTIGLVNEPNNMSTMMWFSAAQAAVTAIRGTGFTGAIHVPGNGWTGAGTWTDSSYDTASPKRSNAYGWLNARGVGLPLSDPAGKLVVGVHAYADPDAGGGTTTIGSTTISRSRVKVAVDWARANGLKVFVGEIGMYAGRRERERELERLRLLPRRERRHAAGLRVVGLRQAGLVERRRRVGRRPLLDHPDQQLHGRHREHDDDQGRLHAVALAARRDRIRGTRGRRDESEASHQTKRPSRLAALGLSRACQL